MRDIREHCPDCAVAVGELHEKGCDIARCMTCGGQWISCPCHYGVDEFLNETDDGGVDTDVDEWTGFWPGELDCLALGLYSYWGPDYGEKGWVKCSPDHPGAGPDLNTLQVVTTWDPVKRVRVPHGG